MIPERHITTRELLRNFKKYKDLLLKGKVHLVSIAVDGGKKLHLSIEEEEPQNTGANLAKFIRKMKEPIHIERPDFDILEDR